MISPLTTGSTPLLARAAQRQVHRSLPQLDQLGHDDEREEGQCQDQRHHRDVLAVEERDHRERREVVHHEDRHQEDPHAVWDVAA
jgi:hypothetical protein